MILLQKRKEVLKDINKEIETTAIKDGNLTIRSKKQLSQIIDTTLLKCYLQVPQNTSQHIDHRHHTPQVLPSGSSQHLIYNRHNTPQMLPTCTLQHLIDHRYNSP